MSYRILVIDHHPQGLERVVGPLRSAGYEVAIARTAADGASSFGHFEPDLVFIAARLPRTHGTVLCRELKRTDAGATTPIVLIVESTEIQIDLPPLDQFGADRLIQKPVGAEELLALCRELLRIPVIEETLPIAPPEDPGGVDYGDDGLSTALEELDALEFDIPEEIVRGAPPPSPLPGPATDDSTEDIDNRLDDLFGGTPAQPSAASEPAPSTARDREADTGVLDELDIDNELSLRFKGIDEVPPPSRAPSPAPRPVRPPAPSVTVASSYPAMPATGPVVGTYQTEALTRRVGGSEPAPAAPTSFALPARWVWAAIPVTVAIVGLGVVLMSRSRPVVPPATPVGDVSASTSTSESADEQRVAALLGLYDVQDEGFHGPPAPGLDEGLPALDAVPEPEPADEPVVAAAPARREEPPVTPPVPMVRREESVVEVEPEPAAARLDAIPIEDSPAEREPAIEAPPVRPVEPPPADEPPPLPEPQLLTRDPILVQRVEPRYTAKDLKKGGGSVLLRIRVDVHGAVTRVVVQEGLPGSPLEGAAVAAVLRWRYEPALDAGDPIEAWTTARFDFDE